MAIGKVRVDYKRAVRNNILAYQGLAVSLFFAFCMIRRLPLCNDMVLVKQTMPGSNSCGCFSVTDPGRGRDMGTCALHKAGYQNQ